jgi:TPR repeat protein
VIRAGASRVLGLLAAFVAAMQLISCAASSSYMGIDLRQGAAPAELQALAERAQAGDKCAQLDLGIAFEEGVLAPINIRSAKKLYSQAASETGGATWVYQPAVGNSAGRLVPFNLGGNFTGQAEAQHRLMVLSKKSSAK